MDNNNIENNNIENKNLYDSFDIFGKNSVEFVNFGKIEIYFEQEINKIKINTIFYPTIYAKQWFKNNKYRFTIRAHGQKPIHKYKRFSIIKLSNINLELDNKSIESIITKNQLFDNIKIHIKEIIQKLNIRTRKEYVFTATNKKYN
jgi:hypothetical protein